MPKDDLPEFILADFLPYRLAVAAGRVSRAFARRYGEEFGLSVPEWRVLAHLARGEALSVRDIFARVDMDKSKVSRAATRLEEMGLVEKVAHPGDGRLVSLSLSPEGRRVMGRLIPMALDYQKELMDALGGDAPSLQAGLDRLMDKSG
jgi:DNA-binding MarR family transcriptional regulator